MRRGVFQVLVLGVGVIVAMCVYSYGMFHTLFPAWSDLADVASCGTVQGAARQANEMEMVSVSGSQLCQVSPGHWVTTPYGTGPLFFALLVAVGSAVVALHRSEFLKWTTKSAQGTAALFLVVFGIPMTLLGLHLDFIEGTLTVDQARRNAFYSLLGGAVMGVLMWYTVIRGLQAKATSNISLQADRER